MIVTRDRRSKIIRKRIDNIWPLKVLQTLFSHNSHLSVVYLRNPWKTALSSHIWNKITTSKYTTNRSTETTYKGPCDRKQT